MSHRYVLSDTHFGHGNIIDYCNRPFDNVEEMNNTLINNWNDKVDEDDSILFLGDVRHHPSLDSASEWLSRLNGNILVVRGNHDGNLPQNTHVNVVESCVIKHGRYQFYCEHQPVEYSGWQIHGHTHIGTPLIDRETQRMNVSVENIDYKTISMNEIVQKLEE